MTALTDDSIRENVLRIKERIASVMSRTGRSTEKISLLGVTKTTSPDSVLAAVRAGVTLLGENYVQEARKKIPEVNVVALCEGHNPSWHLIGHLQTNKAKFCPPLFSVVETVDNFVLAKELAEAASKEGKSGQRLLVEVNLSGDPARAGIAPEETLEFCGKLADLPGLQLEGLMGIASYSDDAEAARPVFRRLRSLWEKLPVENRKTLSMGMSGDFEVAIEEGTTLIRIGSAIFGARSAQRNEARDGNRSADRK